MMSSSRGPHHLANTSAATPGRWLTTGTTRLGLYFVFVKTRSILLSLLLVRAVSLYFINKFLWMKFLPRDAMHARYMLWPYVRRLSVCPDTSLCSTKMAKRRIAQTTPHDSPGSQIFWWQRSPWNSTAIISCGGAKCRWVGQNRRLSTNSWLYLESGTR